MPAAVQKFCWPAMVTCSTILCGRTGPTDAPVPGRKNDLFRCVDRAACLRAGDRLSPTVPWEVNREIFGAVQLCRSRVDGVILMSAFPCGPDSMTNDMLVRLVKDCRF